MAAAAAPTPPVVYVREQVSRAWINGKPVEHEEVRTEITPERQFTRYDNHLGGEHYEVSLAPWLKRYQQHQPHGTFRELPNVYNLFAPQPARGGGGGVNSSSNDLTGTSIAPVAAASPTQQTAPPYGYGYGYGGPSPYPMFFTAPAAPAAPPPVIIPRTAPPQLLHPAARQPQVPQSRRQRPDRLGREDRPSSSFAPRSRPPTVSSNTRMPIATQPEPDEPDSHDDQQDEHEYNDDGEDQLQQYTEDDSIDNRTAEDRDGTRFKEVAVGDGEGQTPPEWSPPDLPYAELEEEEDEDELDGEEGGMEGEGEDEQFISPTTEDVDGPEWAYRQEEQDAGEQEEEEEDAQMMETRITDNGPPGDTLGV